MSRDDKHFRIAIASDLHAYNDTDSNGRPSYLDISTSPTLRSQHPVEGLKHYVHENNITADLLLCPGDLTDKARPQPLSYAWDGISEIGKKLGVGLISGTAGNHDLDSRYEYNNYDASGMLQSITPRFPLPNDDINMINKYWAKHYVIKETKYCRIIILNSSAYHGGGKEEWKHGRISTYTLEWIEDDLSSYSFGDGDKVNILLCHHHPIRHSGVDSPDYDAMKRGSDLLDLLGSGRYGRWLIVHGHKHFPKVHYAPGSAAAPVIFSAGSFSATPDPEMQGRARNQFYVLELCPDDIPEYGLVGQGHAWDYIHGEGWSIAGPKSGLPAKFGFGCRDDPIVLTNKVASLVRKTGSTVDWSDVVDSIPKLKYVLPSDLRQIQDLLEENHDIYSVKDQGRIQQVGPQV